MNVTCDPCPVCGHQPKWHGSMIRDAESIGCDWEAHCPKEGSFDFVTDYLPVDQAVAAWNGAVAAYEGERGDGS